MSQFRKNKIQIKKNTITSRGKVATQKQRSVTSVSQYVCRYAINSNFNYVLFLLCVTLTESSLYIGVGLQGTGSGTPLIQCKRLPQMDRMIRLYRRPGRIWNRHPAPDVKTAGGCFNGGGKSSGLTLMGKFVYYRFWTLFKQLNLLYKN